MPLLTSASLAANYGPPGSAGASLIQALAVLIPVLAIGLLCAASPHARAQLSRIRMNWREYFYGPQKRERAAVGRTEETSAPEAPAGKSVNELQSFDHSIYDESGEDEEP